MTMCLRQLLSISSLEHKSNDGCWAKSTSLRGPITSSGLWQETEACMVRACRTQRQPLQNRPSGHLGGWATPWTAGEVLDGRSKSGHPCPCQSCSQGLLQKSLEEDLCWIVPMPASLASRRPNGQRTKVNWRWPCVVDRTSKSNTNQPPNMFRNVPSIFPLVRLFYADSVFLRSLLKSLDHLHLLIVFRVAMVFATELYAGW